MIWTFVYSVAFLLHVYALCCLKNTLAYVHHLETFLTSAISLRQDLVYTDSYDLLFICFPVSQADALPYGNTYG